MLCFLIIWHQILILDSVLPIYLTINWESPNTLRWLIYILSAISKPIISASYSTTLFVQVVRIENEYVINPPDGVINTMHA